MPDPKDITTINVRYRVIEPFVDIHIYWDAPNNELAYEVEEPKLTEEETKNLRLLEEGLTELINISYINIEDMNIVIEFLEKTLKILLDEFGIKVSEETFLKYMYFLYRDLIGMNQVEPLLKDYFIEDIECNGFGTPIYIVHRKYRNLRTNIIFQDIRSLSGFVEKLAQKCSQYVSYANPLLDGVLPDGSRVNATYTEDVTSRGPTFTLRKFTKEPWTPIKLMDFRTVSPEILAYLWLLIDNKSNILIIGGTGSGKTSFLNAMAFFIPPAARVVSIEDTRELNLRHENWLPAVSRQGAGNASITGEKHGEVSLFDLLKESLRQSTRLHNCRRNQGQGSLCFVPRHGDRSSFIRHFSRRIRKFSNQKADDAANKFVPCNDRGIGCIMHNNACKSRGKRGKKNKRD